MQEKALHGKGVKVLDSYLSLGNPQDAEGLQEVPSLLAVPSLLPGPATIILPSKECKAHRGL